ncbi:MAG: metallophosphatase family protein [Deltaproteobacteria bacterium]|nr:metallophosphatase family protein [Deltaproteobacteria bacterium]MCF8120479.1 metallophosphatase family protein [Deltaproteobacteria bacterium]
MKIGVLSDTHLKEVTPEFTEIYDDYLADKDAIIHAGDVVSNAVIDFLARKPFYGVHGNMDPVEVKDRLPEKRIINLAGYTLGIVHGWGQPEGLEDRILPLFQDVDVLIYGHSHRGFNEMRGGVLLFNPGTATGFSFSGQHSIGVLDLDDMIRGEIIPI